MFFSASFDVAAWIKSNITEADKNKASTTGPGLKIAGTDSNGKEDEGVGIMLAMDKDEAVQRQERDAQAEIKRQQNALPSWHLKSTITGDLTALGIKESTREVAMPNGAQQASNDDILKGLGVVGGGSVRGTAGQAAGRVGLISMSSQEDVKPAINVESDRIYFSIRPFFYILIVLLFSLRPVLRLAGGCCICRLVRTAHTYHDSDGLLHGWISQLPYISVPTERR